jgi:YggT family protein
MIEVLTALAALTEVLRSVLLAGGIALAAVAAGNWATRTRRINPFSGVARFMRGRVDPRLAGIERRVVRAGGHPSATPWWALVVYVVVGALLLAAVGMVGTMIRQLSMAGTMGAMGMVILLVRWTFGLLRLALLVRVLSSWFPALAYSRWTRWSFGATEWMLRPLRNLIPSMGVIDVTPIIAYFGLQLAQWLVESMLMSSFG